MFPMQPHGSICDPVLLEDPAPFSAEISRYQKYGELLKNSVESYPMRDEIVFVMKDMARVERAAGAGEERVNADIFFFMLTIAFISLWKY